MGVVTVMSGIGGCQSSRNSFGNINPILLLSGDAKVGLVDKSGDVISKGWRLMTTHRTNESPMSVWAKSEACQVRRECDPKNGLLHPGIWETGLSSVVARD